MVRRWEEAFRSYLSDPETGKNFEIVEIGEAKERNLEKLTAEIEGFPEEGEICLEFLTPFPFKRERDRQRTFITKVEFIRAFEKRFSRLFGEDIRYEGSGGDFSLLPYYWHYTEIRHPSHSQPGNLQYINGCTGRLYLKGRFKDILPFLILGSELHTGSKFSNSQGYYIIHKESPGYFQRYLPNKRILVSVIRDVVERYDNAIVSLSVEAGLPFDEERFADEIIKQIVTGTYTPSPNIAFMIKKRTGDERMVEQLSFKELIIQQYILNLISAPFDRIFEEGSIGFRKGISRSKAIERVKEAIREGFQYVIESDIEDFFPSVDLNRLDRLIDFYIPDADGQFKDLIRKVIRNGYILNGVYHERVKGLAQGSPLSPILANLYLDSFDEQIMGWNVRMIRYADDFIIMTRKKEEAEEILSRTEAFLSDMGLRLKKEKTALRRIEEGFRFLGMRFEKSEIVVKPEEEFRRLKKPLYITEPYLFLSLNGEAIDIKKQGMTQETIPLRRISEIIIMERSSLSTALITRCAENYIPITITLDSGYYITTIKPDSKRYHDISYEHARRYYSLTETEILSIAKEFAVHKLLNYLSLFRQRYSKGLNKSVKEIESYINSINRASDINQVRGFEGASQRIIYEAINGFIDDSLFHIRKRERKNPDRINSLLNLGYYLLFSRINATTRAIGLNPYLGFLHSPEDDFESLVCDIQELFRARIDRLIIKLVNLKIIKGDDFIETAKGWYLTKVAKRGFLNHFEAEMERGSSGNGLSLKEAIYVQTVVIKDYILKDKPITFYRWDEGWV
ncbi:MAG: hypothetical protein Fur0020_14950 [Thermodesulfovibrionia bacterium]